MLSVEYKVFQRTRRRRLGSSRSCGRAKGGCGTAAHVLERHVSPGWLFGCNASSAVATHGRMCSLQANLLRHLDPCSIPGLVEHF